MNQFEARLLSPRLENPTINSLMASLDLNKNNYPRPEESYEEPQAALPDEIVDQGNMTIRSLVFGPSSTGLQKNLKKTDPTLTAPASQAATQPIKATQPEKVEYNRMVKEEREKSNEFIKQLISSIKLETRKEAAEEQNIEEEEYNKNDQNDNKYGVDNLLRNTMTTLANNDNKLIQEYEKELKRQELNTVDFSMTSTMNFDERMRMSSVMPVGSQIFDEKPKASSTANASQLVQQIAPQNNQNNQNQNTKYAIFIFE
jgi:hypothetical protein